MLWIGVIVRLVEPCSISVLSVESGLLKADATKFFVNLAVDKGNPVEVKRNMFLEIISLRAGAYSRGSNGE